MKDKERARVAVFWWRSWILVRELLVSSAPHVLDKVTCPTQIFLHVINN